MNFLRILLLGLVVALTGCASAPNSKKNTASTANKALIAQDTSRTIDLTSEPKDMWDRIRRGYAIPNLNDDLVTHWTNYYAKHPESVIRMSERASKYLYYVVNEIEARGLPTELALLPFIESAYNPTAYSHAHAAGLWQFIPSTGLHYDLAQNWWQDQRRDPIAATDAALRYLSYLYEFQGDWYLALASYNWGEGSVQRAMKRNADAELETDYLSLTMPKETRNYVPKLQAIKNIITDPERYNISLPEAPNAPYFIAVSPKQNIDVSTAAQLAEMTVEEFKLLNPSHNREIILAEHAQLNIPAAKAAAFSHNLASYDGALSKWQTYQPQRGDSFNSIAQRHGVTVNELRQMNGLSARQTLASAATLLVPITHDHHNDTIAIQLASLDKRPALQHNASQQRGTPTPTKANIRTHRVQKGDTLFGIARKYNITVDELKKLNNLTSNAIQTGKQLRIPGTNIRS